MKKGVSPLLAVAALILLTIVAATALIAVTQGFIGQSLQDAEGEVQRTRGCLKMGLRTDNAFYDSEQGTVTTVVRNIGNVDLTNFRFIVYYKSDPIFPNILTPANAEDTLVPGELLVLKAGGVASTPDKMLVESLWQKGQCPDRQPLDECNFVGNDFVC